MTKRLSAGALIAFAALVVGLGLTACGDSAKSVAPEAAVVESSEQFLEAFNDRDGGKICDLSSTKAISGLLLISGSGDSDCASAMDELLAKVSESKIEQDNELLEALSSADVEIDGDVAHLSASNAEFELIEADGKWLLNDTSEREALALSGEQLSAQVSNDLERVSGTSGDLVDAECPAEEVIAGETFLCQVETSNGSRSEAEVEFPNDSGDVKVLRIYHLGG